MLCAQHISHAGQILSILMLQIKKNEFKLYISNLFVMLGNLEFIQALQISCPMWWLNIINIQALQICNICNVWSMKNKLNLLFI